MYYLEGKHGNAKKVKVKDVRNRNAKGAKKVIGVKEVAAAGS